MVKETRYRMTGSRGDAFDDLPEELRPALARHRAMRTVGAALVCIGCLLLAGAGVWWSVPLAEVALPTDREHHLSMALVGGVSLTHGLIAVVTVDSL